MGATRRDAARRACGASDPDTACVECTAVSGLQEGACRRDEPDGL
ncbi:hypothetical protein BSLA_02r2433 [Burkholderia stabilis]|nr:hypothetical protein BSLA_02r2433 [Burkholderia stabilis]